MSEYDEKYAQELLEGMRNDGKTDIECCIEWGVLYSEYQEWVKKIPEFARAHEMGEMHYHSYWHRMAKLIASKGNASVLLAGMKNLNIKNWVDKKEAKEQEETPITAIEISILPPYEEDDKNSED